MRALSWIRVDVGVAVHNKTERLGDILGVERAHHLVIDLWLAVALVHPDGDLAGVDDAWIARRAGWKGDGPTFVSALVEAGWIDGDRRLHRWDERQGSGGVAAAKAERDANTRSARRKRSVTAPSAVTDRDAAVVTAQASSVTAPMASSTDRQTDPPTDRPTDTRSEARVIERPEPLGPYGERMPRTAAEVLAHTMEGQTLAERWRKHVPTMKAADIERAVSAAIVHRLTLDGPMFGRWFWPDGFVFKVDDWLRRQAKADNDLAASEARARNAQAQGGGYVAPAPTQTQDERKAETLKRIDEHAAKKARGEA